MKPEWLGKKYDDVLSKMGEMGGKTGKRWKFTLYLRENVIFEKGGRANISYFGQKFTPCKKRDIKFKYIFRI